MPHPIACDCYLCRTEEEMSGRLAVRHVAAPAPVAPAPPPADRPWLEWADLTLLVEVGPGGTPSLEQRVANAARILAALDERIGRHWSELPEALIDIQYDLACAMRSLGYSPDIKRRPS
jgi:hypothetical protein